MSNVKVAIRCRPKLGHEQLIPATKIETNEVDNSVTITTSNNNAKRFSFDKVLSESSTQQDVFGYISPLVDRALDGMHATCFAYGQTGSGKTYTMEGFDYVPSGQGTAEQPGLRPRLDTPASQHGIVPRLIQLIFDRARERMGGFGSADEADSKGEFCTSTLRYRLKCSFMQLYNERVTDLLNPSSTRNLREGLKIRWTRDDQFIVENLFVFECDTPEQMREIFVSGIKEKVMGSHHMNIQSSRSHCLFTIHVHSWDTSNPDLIRKSELSLVDLAGSEKLALLSKNPSAQLVRESIEINTSLLSLGKVITALSGKAKGHVPYRDSKLTKLLKHALGGNAYTIMIACISPLDPYVEESLSTLLYAGRARNITNEPKVNEDPRSALIRSLREEITLLKQELDYYRQLVHSGVVDDHLAKQLASRVKDSHVDPPRTEICPGTDNTNAAAMGGATSEPGNNNAIKNREEELADKLLESCTILKNIMDINSQLRKAFDSMKAMKEASERKEVAVNAENIALRERIEILESITLREDSTSDFSEPEAKDRDCSVDSERRMKRIPVSADSPRKASKTALYLRPNSAQTKASARQQNFLEKRINRPRQRKAPTYTQRLQAYSNKYRNPLAMPSYEDYYGRGHSTKERQKPNELAEKAHVQSKDLNNLISQLSKNLPERTLAMIPESLQPGRQAFGSLAFGGTEEERSELEERRRQRQQRLHMLQQQNAALQNKMLNPLAKLNVEPLGQTPSSTRSVSSWGREAPPSDYMKPSNKMEELTLVSNYNPSTEYLSFKTNSNSGEYSAPNFLGSRPRGRAAEMRLVQLPRDNSYTSKEKPSSKSATSLLFEYLSKEETESAFTAEQLEKLKLRKNEAHNNSLQKWLTSQCPISATCSNASDESRRRVSPRGIVISSPHGSGRHLGVGAGFTPPHSRNQTPQERNDSKEGSNRSPGLRQSRTQHHYLGSLIHNTLTGGQGAPLPSEGQTDSPQPAYGSMDRRERRLSEQALYQKQLFEAQQELLEKQLKRLQQQQRR